MASKKKSSPQPQDDSVYRVKHISRSAWEDGTQGLPGLPPAGPAPPPKPPRDTLLEDVAADLAMTGEIPLERIRELLRQQEQEAQAKQAQAQLKKQEGKRQETRGKKPEPFPGYGPIRPEEIISLPAAPPPPAKAKKEPPQRSESQKSEPQKTEKPKSEKRPKAPPAQAETAREPAPPEDEIEAAKQLLLRMKARSRFPETPPPKEEKPEPAAPSIEKKPEQAKPKRARPDKPTEKEEKIQPIEEPKREKRPKSPKPEPEPPQEDIAPQADAAQQKERRGLQWLFNTIRLFFTAEDEEREEDFWDDNVPLYHVPVRALLERAYRDLYYFGLRFARPFAIFRRHALPYMLHPVLALWHFLRALALALKHFTIGQAQRALAAGRQAHAERMTMRKASAAPARSPGRAMREWAEDYRPILRPAFNALLPAAALAVLLVVVLNVVGQGVDSQVYALQVRLQSPGSGDYVAMVSDEGVYLEAQAAANRHMGLLEESADPEETQHVQFSLERVPPEELTSADLLCDQLLQHSPNRVVSACGVYVAGQEGQNRRLVAAIRNSTDATSVLESIKKEKSGAQRLKVDLAKGDTIGFVQEIDLVPGFYPEDKLLSVQELMNLLSGKVKEEVYYTLKEGNTISGIASGIAKTPTENLLRMNPWLRGKETSLHPGDKILVDEQVDFLQVKVVRTEKRTVTLPFEVVNTYNSRLWRNEVVVRTKGVPGEEEIIERVTYINGIRQGAEEVARTRTKAPVNERRDVGNRNPIPDGWKEPIYVGGGFLWPVIGCTRISSGYGYRGNSFHKGIDIADGNTNGKVIIASKAGVVEIAQYSGSYGNMILINHGGGVKTRYAHMMNGSMAVSPGQQVSAGQPIGRVGRTGNSTGPHLHFEVIINGQTQNPRNYVRP